ncbi:gliding motility protein GldC [Nonlabens sp.]|uniref:gliding motility protein GldC n=1 Tax=Nonlabens sp. TaxID=1888209 RepID=UPI001BCBF4AA|nr:gliding motility protein GldC [Nonlabens sp.]
MSDKKIRSTIKIGIELDENRVPEHIRWSAPDGGVDAAEAKAMMVSMWDSAEKESFRIDLWTKDMPVDEMRVFFHQTLVSMADTYHRATNDDKMRDTMIDFCDYFAEKLNLKEGE